MIPCDFNKDGWIDVVDIEQEHWAGGGISTEMYLKSYAGKPPAR